MGVLYGLVTLLATYYAYQWGTERKEPFPEIVPLRRVIMLIVMVSCLYLTVPTYLIGRLVLKRQQAHS